VAVSNCTAALHLALVLAGIGQGDEVILPSMTFVATANAVRYVGATPIFADIESIHTPHLTAKTIKEKITDKTRAIMPMHYAGYPCRMLDIHVLANKHGLKVVEDVAHGPIKLSDDRWVGMSSDFACYSFYANKTISAGEGGMLICKKSDDAANARLLRSHALSTSAMTRHLSGADGYDVVGLGYNYRMDEMRAVLGRAGLKQYHENREKRQTAVLLYRDLLKNIPGIVVPFNKQAESSFHLMPIDLENQSVREKVIDGFNKHGIGYSVHYPPVHLLSAYENIGSSGLTNTEIFAECELSLPLYPSITPDQIEMVVQAIRTSF